MINFSIIIPHKDTPDLLQECIDSIPVRDDIQVIVVDDNSDTDKVDFDNFPQWKGEHYEYYLTKEGRGAGYARNVGLDHAIGKWIVFADADDFFMPDFAKAMDEYVDTDWELVFFKGCGMERPSRRVGHRADGRNDYIDLAINTGDYRYLFTMSSPWCKFYKHSFLTKQNIRFHEVRWSNDVYFGAQCAFYAERYIASPTCIYCLTNTEGSLTTYKSAECYRVRLIEAIDEMSLLYPKFGNFNYMHYWFYRSWYSLWNTNRFEAIKLVDKCTKANKGIFFRYLWKYLLFDTYNDSKRIKHIIRYFKGK